VVVEFGPGDAKAASRADRSYSSRGCHQILETFMPTPTTPKDFQLLLLGPWGHSEEYVKVGRCNETVAF